MSDYHTRPDGPIDIYVIGTGMVGSNQLTREAVHALERSERLYWAGEQDRVREYLRSEYVSDTVDLTEEYQDGLDREVSYRRMKEAVLDGAEEADEPVAFALHGHPFVFARPAEMVVEEAAERDLTVETQPGISALSCVFADFNLDPMHGFQIIEASDLIVREWELNPQMPTVIWQLGAIETVLYKDDWSRPERYTRFRKYLEEFYPSDHEIELLQAATYPAAESDRFTFEVGELESMHETIDRGMYVLHLPPVEERPIQNEEAYEEFQSEDHFSDLTH